jgi:type I restriction enzyme S subunit
MQFELIGDLVGSVEQRDPHTLGRPWIVYLDIASVDNASKQVSAPQRVAANLAPSRARQLVHTDDVLVSTVRPNLNAIALVQNKFDGEVASTGFCVLRPKKTNLSPKYLFYFAQTAGFVSHLSKIATGASYPAVTDNDIFETPIPLPDVSEQKRIAGQLEQADRLRRTRRYALELSDTFLPATFLELFGDQPFQRVLFEDLALPERGSFVNGPFGSNLLTSELVRVGVPVIYIRDIAGGRYERVSTVCITPAKAEELSICIVLPGDLLIAKVGDPPGIAAIYPHGLPPGVITQDVIRLRPNTELVLSGYLRSFLNSHIGYKLLKPIIVQGTRERFGLTPLKELQVPVPPLPQQKKFAVLVERHECLRASQREALRQAEHLFQTLLHRAFTVEI